jgi:hypothetical protein
LTRAKSTSKWRVLQRLGNGDELVEMDVSRHARGQDASPPRTWTMRAIRYHRKGFRPQTVLTSLLDAKRYPADEMERVAKAAKVEPTRISFVESLRLIRDEWA